MAAERQVKRVVAGDRRCVDTAAIRQTGEAQCARCRRRVVHRDMKGCGVGAVARGVRYDGTKLVTRIGQFSLGCGGCRPGGAAIGGDLVHNGRAGFVVGNTQSEAAVLGDAVAVRTAAINQAYQAQRARSWCHMVQRDQNRVCVGAVARRVADHGAELVARIAQVGLRCGCCGPG